MCPHTPTSNSLKTEGNELGSAAVIDFEIAWLGQSPEIRRLCALQSLIRNLSDSSEAKPILNDFRDVRREPVLRQFAFWQYQLHFVHVVHCPEGTAATAKDKKRGPSVERSNPVSRKITPAIGSSSAGSSLPRKNAQWQMKFSTASSVRSSFSALCPSFKNRRV